MAELVAYAKKNPGKLPFGSAGNGSPQHVVGELLKQRGEIFMVHVPYRGIGPALTDLLAGNIQVMVGTLASVTAQLAAGKKTDPDRLGCLHYSANAELERNAVQSVGRIHHLPDQGYPRGIILGRSHPDSRGGTGKHDDGVKNRHGAGERRRSSEKPLAGRRNEKWRCILCIALLAVALSWSARRGA
ncbi:Bug family tripartite tricarboxylate transporter substrate binding protein [Ottowia caeni]|uniref:Bug family tripartite tricarboxylate transporter substrate binding protein n=1 Tax=Ottowia caeni TaxID=2870339 RepID=UPI003D716F92